MSKVLHFFLFFYITLSSFSQNSNFKGTVVEEGNNTRMVNAIVTIQRTALVQTTNENGEFIFNQSVPIGEHTVTITKAGYEDKSFLIEVYKGQNLNADRIEIAITKQEKKRRKKIIKEAEKRNKDLAKEEKKLRKNHKKVLGIFNKKSTDVKVSYEEAPTKEEVEEETLSLLQIKYGRLLGVAPEEITAIALYEFIDEWMSTPYLLGGATKEGVDCSSFTQRLYQDVYDSYIERTAQKQRDSKDTDKFGDLDFLEEGDLLFFAAPGGYNDTITHVGIYLGNSKFINSTSNKDENGISGVQISNLSDHYWKSRYYSAGRRVIN